MKILFQGDSITDAFRKPEEINPAFQLGNGYAFLVGARLAVSHPERKYEFHNRGVSGQRAQDLAARWQEDALDLQPNVLSLLVGVNLMIRRQQGIPELSDSEFFDCYRSLLGPLRAQNPLIKLILLEPYLLEAGPVTAGWKEGFLPIQAGIAQIAQDYRATHIPLQRIFDEALSLAPANYWAYDGIHATHAGFQLIADAWLQAAAPVLGLDKLPYALASDPCKPGDQP
jgi:lysophospholipase L1-like esterase